MRNMFFVLLAMLLYSARANAQDVCAEAAGQSDRAIREQYQLNIDYFLQLAAAAQAKGFDPRNFPQADANGDVTSIDLIEVAQRLTAKRDDGVAAVFAAYQKCEQRIAPYQEALDIGTFFLTLGIRQAIPASATRIDAGRLFAGTPFGGPNALLPQAREYLLNRLGIGGSAAEFIRNPLQVGPGGLFRGPWASSLLPGLSGGALPNIPPLTSLPSLPPLPPITAPPPMELGKIGNHRVCLPWC